MFLSLVVLIVVLGAGYVWYKKKQPAAAVKPPITTPAPTATPAVTVVAPAGGQPSDTPPQQAN